MVVILEFGGSAVTQRAVQPGAVVPGDVLHDRAYLAIGRRGADGNGKWTWHSLRHVFCTTALFTWKLDPTDVSCMAGHANVRTTLLMYVGTTAGVLDRARKATD
jgi:integrase